MLRLYGSVTLGTGPPRRTRRRGALASSNSGASLARIWSIRHALARGDYDVEARLPMVVDVLWREICRGARRAKKGA